ISGKGCPCPGRGVASVAFVLRGVAVASAVAVLAAFAASAASGRSLKTYSTKWTPPLRTALFDPFTFNGPQYATGFQMARRAGAGYVRIAVSWSEVAPARPASASQATDPAWPGYDWRWPDAKVEAAEAAGLTPYLQIGSAPSWAANAKGTPKPAFLGQFAKALALHYDGAHGAPPVHVFQVWNEPNLSLDLSPPKPVVYRAMVNAAAAAIHSVDPANLVVAGGLDPFGNKARPGTPSRRSPSCAPCSASRPATRRRSGRGCADLTPPAAPASISTSGRTIRTPSTGRSATRAVPTTCRSATCPRCGRCSGPRLSSIGCSRRTPSSSGSRSSAGIRDRPAGTRRRCGSQPAGRPRRCTRCGGRASRS